MAEEPSIAARGSEPEKTRYGAVVYGLKVLIDSVAQASGLRASVVVAAMGGMAMLAVSVVTGAGVVLLTARQKPAAPAAPAEFPAAAQPVMASIGPVRSSGQYPRSGMMAIPGMGPVQQRIPASSPEADISAYDEPEEAAEEGQPAPAAARPQKKKKKFQFETRPLKESNFSGITSLAGKPEAQSKAQMDKPREAPGKLDAYAREVSEVYGDGGLPGVPKVDEGRSLGPSVEAPKPVKKSKQKIEGPVEQKEVPDVGPGRQVSAEPTGGAPKGAPRITSGGDPLSTPIDVNRIQLDPSKTHNIDQTAGVSVIGK